ncbi:hypothetical protein L6164_006381 [Bauhinia variegata]|uniref:Uncharacterized protein n=1 Tax=Bauhinia variegata TaxID=167791 RepID=A0ACB9PUU7_BAUVA|nr:hypothetical protein L6164_006381 [Bauhinia variegata]
MPRHINCIFCRNRWNSCCSFMCIYLSFLIIIIAVFIFILAVAIWSFTFPSDVTFHVTEASLKQFNLTANNTLFYNLRLNATARNPSKRVTFDYKRITVTASYKENQFDKLNLIVTPFHQAHKNTTSLMLPVIQGQQVLKLKTKEVTEYNEETSAGVYNIDVDLDIRVRKKVGLIKYHESWNLVCNLKVPVSSNDKSVIPFNKTECKGPPNEDTSAAASGFSTFSPTFGSGTGFSASRP